MVLVDGTYFQSWCLLIAYDGRHVLDWQQILRRQRAPEVAVLDGGTGLHAAIAAEWPSARIQRCYFHIMQTVRRHHPLRPRLQPGKELLTVTRALMKVRNPDQAIMWLQAYSEWEQRWDSFLRHRTYPKKRITRPVGVPETSTCSPGSTPQSPRGGGRPSAARHLTIGRPPERSPQRPLPRPPWTNTHFGR